MYRLCICVCVHIVCVSGSRRKRSACLHICMHTCICFNSLRLFVVVVVVAAAVAVAVGIAVAVAVGIAVIITAFHGSDYWSRDGSGQGDLTRPVRFWKKYPDPTRTDQRERSRTSPDPSRFYPRVFESIVTGPAGQAMTREQPWLLLLLLLTCGLRYGERLIFFRVMTSGAPYLAHTLSLAEMKVQPY